MTLRELPEWINKFRIFPRIFISVYIYMFYEVVQWAMTVEDLSNPQSILVSVVVGAGCKARGRLHPLVAFITELVAPGIGQYGPNWELLL